MSEDDAGTPTPTQGGLARAFVLVLLPFSLGYYLSYLYRAINAVIAPQLTSEIGLNAAGLGLLTATYFLAGAAVQLPLGIALDRFGPRRVQGALLAVAAAGALVFAASDGMAGLVAGRALIGLGVSATLVGSFKIITLWFPQSRWPAINGFLLAMGGVGAMSATKPVEILLGVTDWRTIFVGLAVVTVAVAAVIVAVVPERRGAAAATPDLGGQVRGIASIYRDRLFWRVAPLAVACQATGISIQTLWAGPWLGDVAGLARDGVASMLLVIAAAMTAGFLGLGLSADFLERRGLPLLASIAAGAAIYIAATATIVFAVAPDAAWPWIVFGVMSNVGVLCHPLLTRAFPVALSGRVFTSLNLLVILGAFSAQAGIGAVINLWPPAAGGGYAPDAYRAAFGVMLALQVAAFVWFLVPGAARKGRAR